MLFCLLVGPYSFAKNSLTIGSGLLSQFHGQVQINNDGDMNGLSLRPYFDLGYNMPLGHHFSMLYDFGWVFAHKRSADTISRTCYFLNTHLSLHWGNFTKFGFFVGGGLFLTSITGQGGTDTLNNGNTTTDYPLPFNTSLGSNLTFNYGTFLRIGIISLETMVTSFNMNNAIKNQNQFSATLKIHIPMGDNDSEPVKVRQKPSYQPQPEYQYDQDSDFF